MTWNERRFGCGIPADIALTSILLPLGFRYAGKVTWPGQLLQEHFRVACALLQHPNFL